MADVNRETFEQRLAAGLTAACAHAHHSQCKGKDGGCTCTCHSKAQANGHTHDELTPGQKAARTRAKRRESAPKREASTPGIPANKRRQLKSAAATVIAGSDWAVRSLKRPWWTEEDKFEASETSMLVDALYSELENYPKVLKWIADHMDAAGHAQLGMALLMIAAPRLARRGMLPVEVASAIVYAPLLFAQQQPEPPTADVGAGATPGDHRANGNGQVDVSVPPPNGTAVRGDTEVEARLGPL